MSETVRLFCHETFQKVQNNTKVLSSLPAPSYLAMSRSSAVRSAAVSKLCSSLVQFQFRFFHINPETSPLNSTVRSCDTSLRNTRLLETSWKRNKHTNVMRKKSGKKRKNNERKQIQTQLTSSCS